MNRIAGTHTTSATASLLFYHLLHAPETMAKCKAEIDTSLPPLESDRFAYPAAVVESSLPYLRDCVKENFRLTPVFTMPLPRRLISPEGLTVAGQHIPQGVSYLFLLFKGSFLMGDTDLGCSACTFVPPQPNDLGR